MKEEVFLIYSLCAALFYFSLGKFLVGSSKLIVFPLFISIIYPQIPPIVSVVKPETPLYLSLKV